MGFEASREAPAVQAHEYSLQGELELKAQNYKESSRCYRLASELYAKAAHGLRDGQTIYALKVLADSHEKKADSFKDVVENGGLKEDTDRLLETQQVRVIDEGKRAMLQGEP